MSTLSGSSLFTGITSGLSSTYSAIAKASTSGVTATSISDAMSNTSNSNSVNSTFASYILSNFTSLDKDSDGKLSATELNNLTNMISSTGLTSTQISQLGTASGLSSDTIQQVLDHFNDIDTNHDGKVTMAEINGYSITSAEEKKRTEYSNKAASDMSVFYASDSSSSDTSSSILSYKYLSDDSESSSSSS